MSVFPIGYRTRYLRSLLEGGMKRPADMQLTHDDKQDLVRKILLIVNSPLSPTIRNVEELIDSDLFRAYPWMSDQQRKVFEFVQESDTSGWHRPYWGP